MPGILGALAFGGLLAGREGYQRNQKAQQEQQFQQQLQALLGQSPQTLNQGPVDASQPGSGLLGALDEDLGPFAEFSGGLLGLDGLQSQGGSLLGKIIDEQLGRGKQPDPTNGTITTIVGPDGSLRRMLIDPQNGQPIADLGEAPKAQPLVKIDNGTARDLPATQASEIGGLTNSLNNSRDFVKRYKPEFSNVGIDILGGVGANIEMFKDRVTGDNTDRTAFWNDLDSDKTEFTKARFGGNASDADRATIDRIYPNPRNDDNTNKALLQNLETNKRNLLSAKTKALSNAGFEVDRSGGGGTDQVVDFDLTK